MLQYRFGVEREASGRAGFFRPVCLFSNRAVFCTLPIESQLWKLVLSPHFFRDAPRSKVGVDQTRFGRLPPPPRMALPSSRLT